MAKHAPVLLQLSDTECGIATLAMIFAYFKRNISLEELRDKSGASRDGCSAKTLINIANEYGFEANAYRVDINTLAQLKHPVIAYWKFSHYVVINQVSRSHVCINDPAYGKVYLPIAELNRSFTGIIINIEPTISTPLITVSQTALKMSPIPHVDYFFMFTCLIISTITPYAYIAFINAFFKINYSHLLAENKQLSIIALTVTPIMILIATLLYKKSAFQTFTSVTTRIHQKLIHHTFHLPMSFFALRQRSEVIANLARSKYITHANIHQPLKLISHIIVSAVCMMGTILFNLKLFICLLGVVLFFLAAMRVLQVHIDRQEKSNREKNSKLHSFTLSCLQNIDMIHAGGIRSYVNEQLKALLTAHQQIKRQPHLFMACRHALQKSQSLMILFCIYFLSECYPAIHLNLNQLTIIYILQIIMLNSLQHTLSLYVEISSLKDPLTRVTHILSYPTQSKSFSHTNSLPIASRAISCQNVSFRYSQHSSESLSNINFSISRSEHIVLTGRSGSGKSTLGKLLCGLFHCHSGDITLFEKRLSDYSSAELAMLCSYVGQDTDLLPGTLYDNLTSFDPTTCPQKVVDLIKICRLEPLVSEVGLHYLIESYRHRFSGGEKQRIELARTLIRNCPLLILDEAMSALDDETIESIMHYLKTKNTTIIYITHQIQHLRHCHRTLVLESGKLIS